MTSCRVLNFVTNRDAECFKRQIDVLERHGVDTTNYSLPDTRRHTEETVTTRSKSDYVRFYSLAFVKSFGSYDLIHANYGLSAPPAVAQLRRPVVLSLWGSDLFGEFGWLTKLCARYADEVIVMSESMAAALNRPCHVIPYGIDMDQFTPMPTREAKRRVDWDPDKSHILFPYPQTQAVKDYPRAKRVVERSAGRIDGEVKLQVVHGVPYDQMSLYMNAADVLLLTSKSEGSPSAVKEALACNLPVVATAVGDVPERLEGVEPSAIGRSDDELVDALCGVLESGSRSNGREAVRHLTIEWTGQQILGVYRQALGRPRDTQESQYVTATDTHNPD